MGVWDLGLEFWDRARSGVLARLQSEVLLTPDLLPVPIQLESPFPIRTCTVGGVVIYWYYERHLGRGDGPGNGKAASRFKGRSTTTSCTQTAPDLESNSIHFESPFRDMR